MKQEKKEGEEKTSWSLFFYLYLLNWLQKCLVKTVAMSCGQSLAEHHRREIGFGTLLPKCLMLSEGCSFYAESKPVSWPGLCRVHPFPDPSPPLSLALLVKG